jgi:hypothetical protein
MEIIDLTLQGLFNVFAPHQILIWTLRVWSGPNPYTHMMLVKYLPRDQFKTFVWLWITCPRIDS